MAQIPTIEVNLKNGKGIAIINESDFDPTIHEKYNEQKRTRRKKVQKEEKKEI